MTKQRDISPASRPGRRLPAPDVHPIAGVYIALIHATERDGLTYDEWVAKITRRFKRAFT